MKEDVIDALKELISSKTEATKHNWDALNPEIQYQGRHITLPGDPGRMPPEKAVEALQRLIRDENQAFNMHEIIDAFPHDALVALNKAMAKLYGWASPQPTPGFFGPKPPQMVSVKTGVNDEDVVQCPLGAFAIPGVDQPINVTFDSDGKKSFLIVYGTFKKKHRHILLELVNEAKKIVKEQSIYRGKALRLSVNSNGDLEMNNPPGFFDATEHDPVLLDDDILEQVETSILVPIQHTSQCKKMKIPLKRGVLLEGPYGTGKSLTARMTARVCQDNGWTFILLDRVQGLRAALEFANRYSPAVVFAEDIDRIAEERNEDANDLINTIDGVVSKRSEIMTILTTNFAEKLNPVILRPGRLDAVISLRAPGPRTAEKLMRHYAGRLLDPQEDLVPAGMELAGQIPASIRECVERAKLGMIGRGANKLESRDLVIAAKTMKNHLALLNRDNKTETTVERLAQSLKEVVSGPLVTDDVVDDIRYIKDTVRDIDNTVN